jgi:hypothetical protein
MRKAEGKLLTIEGIITSFLIGRSQRSGELLVVCGDIQ